MARLDDFKWNFYSPDTMEWSAKVSGPANNSYHMDIIRHRLANVDRSAKEFYRATKIEKVIFNGPATIVFWSDGTKTVVKCDDDEFFDREKGLAMAISKKALGNKGNYYNEFRKWIDTEDQNEEPKVHIKTDYETMETVVRIDGMPDANSLENIANILLEKLRYCTYGGDHK